MEKKQNRKKTTRKFYILPLDGMIGKRLRDMNDHPLPLYTIGKLPIKITEYM